MNILRSTVFSCLFLSIASCGGHQYEMTDQELAKVIADMHIAEVSLKRYDSAARDSIGEMFLQRIEQIHKVDREVIKKDVEALMDNKEKHSELYKVIIEELQALEKIATEKNNPAKKFKNRVNG